MSNRYWLCILSIFIIFTLAVPSVSGSLSDYPKLNGYVNDFADILSVQEEQILTDKISNIEESTSVEIAIVTVKSTNGENRVLYASHIGEKTGVGKSITDNGVVILWSLNNENGGAIATGRGIESILTDGIVGDIGRNSLQFFDRGDYFGGFNYILDQISIIISSQPSYNETQPTVSDNTTINWVTFLIVSVLIVLFFMILIAIVYGSDSSSSEWEKSFKYNEDNELGSTDANKISSITNRRRR